VLADRLAVKSIGERALEHDVLRRLWPIDEDMGKLARLNRRRTIESVISIFRGEGAAGDTTGNSPGSKWVAFNAIAEHLDYGRRYTARTNLAFLGLAGRSSTCGRPRPGCCSSPGGGDAQAAQGQGWPTARQ
jgi:hypothetical protein